MPKSKQLLIWCLAILALMISYLASPDVRDFVNRSYDVLAKADPRDIESGIRSLRTYLLGFGIWAPIVSSVLMVMQMIIAPIPGQFITFTNGLLFGVWWGTLLSWSSAMIGAGLCFGIGRAFGRTAVEKLIGNSSLRMVDRFFDRYGTHAILIARLLPFVPFDPVSYGAGLTSIGFWRFFIATGIGQLPATLVYSWLGHNMTGTIKYVFAVFVLIVALAVALSALGARFQRKFGEVERSDGEVRSGR